MPRYDFRCTAGHITEHVTPHAVATVACACGASARRLPYSPGHVPGVTGMAARPTREAPVHLDRAMGAHAEILDQSRRAGVAPPDFLSIARERVRRGEVAAIT